MIIATDSLNRANKLHSRIDDLHQTYYTTREHNYNYMIVSWLHPEVPGRGCNLQNFAEGVEYVYYTTILPYDHLCLRVM